MNWTLIQTGLRHVKTGIDRLSDVTSLRLLSQDVHYVTRQNKVG